MARYLKSHTERLYPRLLTVTFRLFDTAVLENRFWIFIPWDHPESGAQLFFNIVVEIVLIIIV